MKTITSKWETFHRQADEMQEAHLEFPIFDEKDDDTALKQKFQELNRIGMILEYLTGYTSFLRGHACVIYKNREGNETLTQADLYADLASLFGVKTRQIQYYFAYYVSNWLFIICSLPLTHCFFR